MPFLQPLLIRSAILLACVFHSVSILAQKTPSKDVAAKIRQVETNLMQAVHVKDGPVYSIPERMKHYRVPSLSVAVINNGQIEWAKGYGFADADSTVRVTENTLFQAASISKPVGALAALHWVEQGKFSLDADINTYLKGWQIAQDRFTDKEKVTLRRLLTHNAGLTVHGFPGYAAGKPVPTVVQILTGESPANTKTIKCDTTPGTIVRYSGGGYTVMQKALEDVLGKPFDQIAAETVLSKIGMTNSTFEQPLPARLAPQAATGFRASRKAVEGQWHTYPEKAAAGLWTTPTDLAKYIIEVQQAYLGKSNKVISADMARQMLTSYKGRGLGPGVAKSGDSLMFMHGGANEGYRCEFFAFANRGQGAIVMTNGDIGYPLVQEVMRSIADVYKWGECKPTVVTKATISPEKFTAIKGNYQFQNMKFEVSGDQKKLLVRTNWEGDYELVPLSDQKFIVPENGVTLELKQNGEGKITGFLVQGTTFERKDG